MDSYSPLKDTSIFMTIVLVNADLCEKYIFLVLINQAHFWIYFIFYIYLYAIYIDHIPQYFSQLYILSFKFFI